MNLGIEYLIRTDSLKSFLEVPCSLFLDSTSTQRGRIVHLKETLECSDTYTSIVWHLDHTDNYTHLPAAQEHVFPRDEVFSNEGVILEGFKPIPYAEQPVITNRNAYNSPMGRVDYAYFTHNYLYSGRHRAMKLDWLWEEFSAVMLGDMRAKDISLENITCYDRRSYIQREQHIVRNKYRQVWFYWVLWRNGLLFAEKVAPELVFYSAYERSE